jgi:hypothetical protein
MSYLIHFGLHNFTAFFIFLFLKAQIKVPSTVLVCIATCVVTPRLILSKKQMLYVCGQEI